MSNNSETLLEKAKKINTTRKHRHSPPSDEEYELFLAWAKGEVTYTQIQKLLGISSGVMAYSRAFQYFKRYVREVNQNNPTTNP